MAVEESYTRSAYFPHSGGKARGYNLVTERREYEITPGVQGLPQVRFPHPLG